MHIVVMGAGGVGGYFGAKLARAGESVTLVARGEHLAAIRRDGLRLRSAVEGEYVVRPAAVEDVRDLPVADVVLFCVKAFDTETAAAHVRSVVGPDTAVLSLQNGIDNEDKLDEILGAGHAMGGVGQVFALIERPGVIAHHFLGRIIFGELDGRVSPKMIRPRKWWAMTPGRSMSANTWATPPIAWPAPRISSSLSSLSMPFWSERTAVSGPTTERTCAAAVSVSNAFTQKRTTSATGRSRTSSTAAGRTTYSPSTADRRRSPSRRIAARCSPRATSVTLSPARASFAPK